MYVCMYVYIYIYREREIERFTKSFCNTCCLRHQQHTFLLWKHNVQATVVICEHYHGKHNTLQSQEIAAAYLEFYKISLPSGRDPPNISGNLREFTGVPEHAFFGLGRA